MAIVFILVTVTLASVVILLLRDKPVMVIMCQLVYICFEYFLINQLQLPSVAKYITDLITVLLLFQLIFLKTQRNSAYPVKANLVILVFTAFALFSSVVNMMIDSVDILQNIVFFAWGIRVYYRFYVFFWACMAFLKKEDVQAIFKFLVAMIPCNVLLATFQYFVQGLRDDNVGGFFGIETGSNAFMNMYLCIVAAWVIARYLEARLRLQWVALVLASTLYIAAISELKVLFFEIPLMVMVALLFAKKKGRALRLAVLAVAGVGAGITTFLIFYPGWASFFTRESIFSYSSQVGYSGENTLNRLNGGSYALQHLLPRLFQKLFGLGLGNTEHFLGFQSPFYQQYISLRYGYFSYISLLLETGIIGLALHSLFYLVLFRDAFRMYKTAEDGSYQLTGIMMVFMALILMVYNQSTRLEVAYLLYFVLAASFVPASRQPAASRLARNKFAAPGEPGRKTAVRVFAAEEKRPVSTHTRQKFLQREQC